MRRRYLSRLVGVLGVIGLLSACATGASPPVEHVAPDIARLLVVRHGEAYTNLPHPPPMSREQLDALTSRGVAEVTISGNALKRYPIAAVITSPTGRTRQTAAIIAHLAGLPGVTAEDAAFASTRGGTTPDGRMASWEWRTAEWEAGRDPRPTGGESLEDASTRAVQAAQTVATRYRGRAVVIVTQNDIIAALLGHAAGTPIAQRAQNHTVPTASVSEISVSPDGRWTLVMQGARPAGG
jgi:broad specificity phosphatase PhoE